MATMASDLTGISLLTKREEKLDKEAEIGSVFCIFKGNC
jgi:hypothetical protein